MRAGEAQRASPANAHAACPKRRPAAKNNRAEDESHCSAIANLNKL
jgi:hypothetical protein